MEDEIILDNEITPPVIGTGIKSYHTEHSKAVLVKKDSGTWKEENYIIGKRTPDDKQYCQKVDPLDIHSTAEIRKYITAVETYLSKKENSRSIDEQKGRVLKYMLCFGLGMSMVLWALWAGAISIPNLLK